MDMRVITCGDSAVMLELGTVICPQTADRVEALTAVLATVQGLEPVPTYCGITVHYDPLERDEGQVRTLITEAVGRMGTTRQTEAETVVLPVCYGGGLGPDLPDVAAHCGLSEEEIVGIHSGGAYRVYMLGFTPGFPYLGGMDSRIAMPRLQSPRTAIPWGSVGIAGGQTGVYPSTSPGGWRLIGRTPVRLFDPAAGSVLLRAGMVLRFKPISVAEYLALGGEAQ